MDTITSDLTLALKRAQFLRLQQPAGVCVQVTRGTLWVTVDGRPEDLEIAAGTQHCFEGPASVLIGTLGGEAEFRAEKPSGRPQLAWA